MPVVVGREARVRDASPEHINISFEPVRWPRKSCKVPSRWYNLCTYHRHTRACQLELLTWATATATAMATATFDYGCITCTLSCGVRVLKPVTLASRRNSLTHWLAEWWVDWGEGGAAAVGAGGAGSLAQTKQANMFAESYAALAWQSAVLVKRAAS